jgi:hypothetical protein
MEIVQSASDRPVAHVSHEVCEHDVDILALFGPTVQVCVSKMMPKIVCSGLYRRGKARKRSTPNSVEIGTCEQFAVGVCPIFGKKVFSAGNHRTHTQIIFDQFRRQFFAREYPSAVRTLGIRHVNVPVFKIYVAAAQSARFPASQPATVKKTKKCGNHKFPTRSFSVRVCGVAVHKECFYLGSGEKIREMRL